MVWIESLMQAGSRHTFASTLPADRFYCLLDELPLHLIPRPSALSLRSSSTTGLVLNPECLILADAQLPPELSTHPSLVSGFAQGPIAWVRDEVGNQLPFWLGPELESRVRRLNRNPESRSDLTEENLALLCAAGIVVNPEREAIQKAKKQAVWRRAAADFRQKGYVPLPGLIHPFHVASLRRYYRHRIRNGAIALGDRQSSRRYAAYNDPVARFFHYQIGKVLSIIAGEALVPSYVYMASYLPGAELKKHTDREQCEFSVTLCLDFSPEPVRETPWPIRLDTDSSFVAVFQCLGDGLAYRGTRLPHYRDMLGEGQTSTSIFFHYVGANFSGPLE